MFELLKTEQTGWRGGFRRIRQFPREPADIRIVPQIRKLDRFF